MRRFLRKGVVVSVLSVGLCSACYLSLKNQMNLSNFSTNEYHSFEPLEQPSLPATLAFQKAIICCRIHDFQCIKNSLLAIANNEQHETLISYRLSPIESARLALEKTDFSRMIYKGLPVVSQFDKEVMMELWSIAGEHWPLKTSDHEGAWDYRNDWSKLIAELSEMCVDKSTYFIANAGLQLLRRGIEDNPSIGRKVLSNCIDVICRSEADNLDLTTIFYHTGWLRLLAKMCQSNDFRTSLLAQRCIINLIAKGRYGPNLFPAYGCLTRRDIDIVFIHGFNGSAFFTWRQLGDLHKRDDLQNFTFCWPKDWLSKDLNARAKIILVDYNSGWSFDEIEEAIGEQLIKAGIGKAPLVLVGHSMGGIIVKRLICDRPAIANAIRGIIFFSVPHLGVDHIVPKSLVSPSNLKKLSNSNPYLAQLHNRFVNTILSRPIRILNICELLPMNGLAGRIMGPEPVVSVSDADIGIGRLITTGKTHIEVCKLENRKCFDYGEIIDFVNLIIVDNVNNNRKPKYNWFYDDYLCPF